jgi:hypothetical protein
VEPALITVAALVIIGRAVLRSSGGDVDDVTRCEEALIWVAGTRKLYDLVGRWLEPHRGVVTVRRQPDPGHDLGSNLPPLPIRQHGLSMSRWRRFHR